MVLQSQLWQQNGQSLEFSELCNALYERELAILSQDSHLTLPSIKGRIKSLSHYIKKTADALLTAEPKSPLNLDIQNASWFAKQAKNMPSISQMENYHDVVLSWYQHQALPYGLVIPIAHENSIVLDCINKIDFEKNRLRTNVHGWFDLQNPHLNNHDYYLLKPTKRVMTAACIGHQWHGEIKLQLRIPSLRELLLSTNINWKNFKNVEIP